MQRADAMCVWCCIAFIQQYKSMQSLCPLQCYVLLLLLLLLCVVLCNAALCLAWLCVEL